MSQDNTKPTTAHVVPSGDLNPKPESQVPNTITPDRNPAPDGKIAPAPVTPEVRPSTSPRPADSIAPQVIPPYQNPAYTMATVPPANDTGINAEQQKRDKEIADELAKNSPRMGS